MSKNKIKNNKNNKLSKTEIVVALWVIVFTALFFISGIFYDKMTGAEGLKNIIIATVLKTILAIICIVPIMIYGIKIIKITKTETSIVFVGNIFLTVIIQIIVFLLITQSFTNEQQRIKDRQAFTDWNISCQCISDLISDDYETFTANDISIDKYNRNLRVHGSSRHNYEYTATFYNGKTKVAEMQIGSDDEEYLKNLPYCFDTEITVYKKSGFLRSVKPSVDFGRNESYEHFFTISMNDNRITYEKNIDVNIENLTWSGFHENQNYDIHNSLFGINAEGEENYLDVSYMDNLCDEICLYGIIDGKYRRLSNIIVKK